MFELGDFVRWTSNYTEKYGEVVAVIEEKGDCLPALMSLKDDYYNTTKVERQLQGVIEQRRNYRSYLVAVVTTKKGKPQIYWPRTNGLKLSAGEESNGKKEKESESKKRSCKGQTQGRARR